MQASYWFWIVLTLLFCFAYKTLSAYVEKPFPIMEADCGCTQLHISREAREVIENVTIPIAVVAVIGPYCSGKSFFLNQLLSLSCKEGFDVGHLHATRTKGVWGTWTEMEIDGARTFVLFLDTEACESIGKSDVYDDRIFALVTVMSSLLIYNLPETIHEADMDQLSFAIELAQEFYGRVKGPNVPFEPAKLLWLIQREFFEGRSVQEVVHGALLNVPNHDGNKNIDMVNHIRDSLAVMGDNSTAFSLPQPHLQRTKLCDMPDSELDPIYVKKRDELIQLVASIIRPKIMQGRPLQGKEFIFFLEQILDILNKLEIPSRGSLVEVFNKAILEHCLKLYIERMEGLHLPVLQQKLRDFHEKSVKDVGQFSEEHQLGHNRMTKPVMQLEEEMDKLYRYLIMENEYQSSKVCEGSYTRCADKIDQLQVLKLPSMEKINESFQQCNQNFERECVGPAKKIYEQQMMKLLRKLSSPELIYCNPVWHVIASVFLNRWAIIVAVAVVVLLLYWRKSRSESSWLLPLHKNHGGGSNRLTAKPRSD